MVRGARDRAGAVEGGAHHGGRDQQRPERVVADRAQQPGDAASPCEPRGGERPDGHMAEQQPGHGGPGWISSAAAFAGAGTAPSARRPRSPPAQRVDADRAQRARHGAAEGP